MKKHRTPSDCTGKSRNDPESCAPIFKKTLENFVVDRAAYHLFEILVWGGGGRRDMKHIKNTYTNCRTGIQCKKPEKKKSKIFQMKSQTCSPSVRPSVRLSVTTLPGLQVARIGIFRCGFLQNVGNYSERCLFWVTCDEGVWFGYGGVSSVFSHTFPCIFGGCLRGGDKSSETSKSIYSTRGIWIFWNFEDIMFRSRVMA